MKKCISLLMAGVLALGTLGLSACGSTSSTETAAADAGDSQDDEETDAADDGARDSEAEQIATVNHYSLRSLETVFSDGLAWATVSDDLNKQFLAAINQNGEIVYITEANVNGDTAIATPFRNGRAAVYVCESGSAMRSLPGFVIIDSEGNEVYSDEESYMCGVGSMGDFLIAKHNTGFYDDEWLVSMLDSSLALSESYAYQGGEECIFQDDDLKEFESGVFFRDHYVVNFNKCFAGTMTVVSVVTDDYVVDVNGIYISGSDIAAVESADDLMHWTESDEATDLPLRDKYGKLWLDGLWTDPTMFTCVTYADAGNGEYKTANVYDADLNVVFTYPALPDGTSYRKFEEPSNGLYVAYMLGADKNIYVTAFNAEGAMEYDPVQISVGSQYDDAEMLAWYMTSFAGYAITSAEIVDPHGNVVQIGDDLTALDTGKDFCYETSKLAVCISEGFIYYVTVDGMKLVSLDGTREITELTALFDEDGKLVVAGTN